MTLSSPRKRGLSNAYAKVTSASSPYASFYGQFIDIDTTTSLVTVKLPTSPDAGDFIDLRWVSGATPPTIDGNGIVLDKTASQTFSLAGLLNATIRYRYSASDASWISSTVVDVATLQAAVNAAVTAAVNNISPSRIIALSYGPDSLSS